MKKIYNFSYIGIVKSLIKIFLMINPIKSISIFEQKQKEIIKNINKQTFNFEITMIQIELLFDLYFAKPLYRYIKLKLMPETIKQDYLKLNNHLIYTIKQAKNNTFKQNKIEIMLKIIYQIEIFQKQIKLINEILENKITENIIQKTLEESKQILETIQQEEDKTNIKIIINKIKNNENSPQSFKMAQNISNLIFYNNKYIDMNVFEVSNNYTPNTSKVKRKKLFVKISIGLIIATIAVYIYSHQLTTKSIDIF